MSTVAGISDVGRRELARVWSGRRFVTPSDVSDSLGVDAGVAAQKLARWARDGWVRRVRRGLYIGVPVDATDPHAWSDDVLVVAARVWDPCYFTGWTAARHWGLTDQVFRTTVLKSSERVRTPSATLLDNDYLVVHADADLLSWGLVSEWRDGVRLRFSGPARTVVDILDSPRLGGGIRHSADILETYLEGYDSGPLIEAADRVGNGTVFKRLGYLIEALGLDQPDLSEACRRRLTSGITALDPSGPAGGRRVMRWGLRVNAQVTQEGAS